MKKMFTVCISLLLIATGGQAQFKMPKKVYRIDELEKAKAEAESKGKPITVIYTDEATSCGLCAAASLGAADKLDSKTIILYANARADGPKLPNAILQALRSPEAGKYIPKTIIADATLTEVLAYVPYAVGAEQDRLLKDALRKLPKPAPRSRLARPAPSLPSASASVIPPAENREVRTWTSQSGATVEAALMYERNGKVVLRTKGGDHVEIQATGLSQKDQDYLQNLKNESSSP
jgi:hypothetical protein